MKSKLLKLYNTITVKNKKAIIVVSLVIISLILLIGIGYFHYGIGMSDEIKINIINSEISKKEYDKARDLTNRYIKEVDEKSKLLKEFHLNTIDLCEQTGTGSLDEATTKIKEYINTVKIVKTEVKSKGSYSNYKYIEVTVKNNGKENINYIKIGFDFIDKNGDIIQSDWTNDNSIIKPNATQKITKMVSKDIKFNIVKTEILDFR